MVKTPVQPESWKHHFVPRSLLNYFRPEGDEDFIFAFDKLKGQGFRTSLMNAASQNGFNTFDDGGRVTNFESDFDAVDALLANRLREVHASLDTALTTEQRQDWADLVAVQLVRTPIVRSTMKAVVAQLRGEVAEKFDVELDLPMPSETEVRKAARRLFASREDARQALAAKDMVLFKAPAGTHFRISDRPVTLQSSLPFGNVGLTSRGVTIFMPIGQRLMLGLLCPSIGRKLSRVPIEGLNLPSATRARLIALRTGVASSSMVSLDEEEVRRHNALQIAGSARFVYGPSDDFADVEQIISSDPELREVASSIHLGKMGEGTGARPHMPAGSWLVLFGRNDTHMLEVLDAIDKEPLELALKSQSALLAAIADGPFSEMQYYVHQKIVRMMRDVYLVPIPDAAQVKVQVRHFDPGLDELMKAIDQRNR